MEICSTTTVTNRLSFVAFDATSAASLAAGAYASNHCVRELFER